MQRIPPALKSRQLCACLRLSAGIPRALVGHKVAVQGLRPTLPPFTPADFKALVADCWHPNPDKRWAWERRAHDAAVVYVRRPGRSCVNVHTPGRSGVWAQWCARHVLVCEAPLRHALLFGAPLSAWALWGWLHAKMLPYCLGLSFSLKHTPTHPHRPSFDSILARLVKMRADAGIPNTPPLQRYKLRPKSLESRNSSETVSERLWGAPASLQAPYAQSAGPAVCRLVEQGCRFCSLLPLGGVLFALCWPPRALSC